MTAMHFLMMAIALILAWSIRLIEPKTRKDWRKNWQRSCFFFLFPTLLLLVTFLSVFCMGYGGQMLGVPAGWLSYALAVSFLAVGALMLLKCSYQAWLTIRKIRTYPQQNFAGKTGRLLAVDFPYIAQIGFWNPELVVSQGLLTLLDREHLQAVFAHEQAHWDFRDTFWFFWLSWIRAFTAYLPNTEAWWQELLRLRELRADWRAAREVDGLLLAESLLLVTQAVSQFEVRYTESFAASLNEAMPQNRLQERIESLIDSSALPDTSSWWNWGWIVLTLLPLLTIPLHY